MSDYAWFTGSLIMTVFMIFLFADMAFYNASIECSANMESIEENFNHSDYITGTIEMVQTFLSPCSGLAWWVYLLLLIMVIADIIFVLPFVGD